MPRLILMRGAHHRFFEVDGAKTRIGSHPQNDVVVEGDTAVSRRHCTIRQEDGTFLLEDKSSRTGTFLNGKRIAKPERLAYGDRIGLGESVAIFVAASRPGEDDLAGRRLGNYMMLQEINKELNTETDLALLLELIMDTAIHLIRAERGFLILVKEKQLEFTVARNIDYSVVTTPQFKISNSVIRKVVKEGEPILTSNAQHDLKDMKSIAALELRGVMCVPLRVKSTVIGTLYLDSQSVDSHFDRAGLELLLAFSDQAAIAIENARLLREAKDKEAILSELRVASRIQEALLPRTAPELRDLAVSGRMKAAREVGGDYFDYIWAPPNARNERNLYVAVGDVSGKGVPAGLVMVMARSILRSLVGRGMLPRDTVREGNRLLKQDLKPGMFMSMLLTYVDVATGRLLLAGCGHERPLVFRAREQRVERIEVGGLVWGVVSDIGPHIDEVKLVLEPGDQLLLYTDGVTEATDPALRQYGIGRLEEFLARQGGLPPDELVTALLEELEYHAAGTEQHDDITVIALRRPVA